MIQTNSPRDLFFDQLHDLHGMEAQILETLPELVELVYNPRLRQLISDHTAQTRQQLSQILNIFEANDKSVEFDKCGAIAGLIEGDSTHLQKVNNPDTRDLMIIAHCLRIEMYEVAAYTITGLLAHQLGYIPESESLVAILNEEKAMIQELLEVQPEVFEEAIFQVS